MSLIPTTKTRRDNGGGMIGCNIRPGMTRGGFSTPMPKSDGERRTRPMRKCMEVHQAAMAFLENRVVRS